MEWFIMENSIKMDDLGVPPFKETPIWNNILLVEEILHQLIGGLSWFITLFTRFYTSQLVQDFFHQQYFHWQHRWNVPYHRGYIVFVQIAMVKHNAWMIAMQSVLRPIVLVPQRLTHFKRWRIPTWTNFRNQQRVYPWKWIVGRRWTFLLGQGAYFQGRWLLVSGRYSKIS